MNREDWIAAVVFGVLVCISVVVVSGKFSLLPWTALVYAFMAAIYFQTVGKR